MKSELESSRKGGRPLLSQGLQEKPPMKSGGIQVKSDDTGQNHH